MHGVRWCNVRGIDQWSELILKLSNMVGNVDLDYVECRIGGLEACELWLWC